MEMPRSAATWPSSGCSSPDIMRNSVVLPAPLGPTRPVFSPFCSAAEASMKRIWWPTCLETLSRRIIAAWEEKGVGGLLFHGAPYWKPRRLRAATPCPCLAKPERPQILVTIPLGRFHVQTILLYLAALGAGVSVATQQVLNGNLRVSLQSPAWAGFASYLGGLL